MTAHTRREFLLALTAAAGAVTLAGCARDSTADLIKASFFGPPGDPGAYPATADQIAQLPYATLGVRIGNGKAAVMVLAQQQGDQLTWASRDRVVFITQGGRLVQTVGMARDLARSMPVGADPILVGILAMPPGSSVMRLIDLRQPDELSVPISSTLEIRGPETIEILGTPRATVHVIEHQRVEIWNWTAVNEYWLDAKTGRPWRSLVQYCPQVPRIQLEVLKPAA